MTLAGLAPGSAGWTTLPFDVDIFLCRGASPGPVALITAGVHGDEYEGPAAVAELASRLRADSICGGVIAIPVANPMAWQGGTRVSPEDGKNLARTFPGDALGSPTERLAASIFGLLTEVDYLIDLHSGGVEYLFTPLAGFYGAPGSENGSYQAARRFGLPVLWQLPATSGVLSNEAFNRGITAIGMEFRGAGLLSPNGIRSYVAGALSCLALWGILPDEPVLPESGEVVAGDWLLSPAEGLFKAQCQLDERVEPGSEVAVICNPRGEVIERLVATQAGRVIALRSKAYIRKGDWGVLIASVM